MRTLVFLFVSLIATTVLADNFVTKKVVEPVTEVIIEQRRVQFDSDYFLGINGYLDGQYNVAQNLENNELNLAVSELRELIKLLKDGINCDKREKVDPPPKVGSNLDTKVFDIFKKNCARCHGSSKSSGNLTLVNSQDGNDFLTDLSCEERTLVFDSVLTGTMPKDGQPLSDEDVDIIRQWMVDKARKERK